MDKVLTITAFDLDGKNYYIGPIDVSDFKGQIEIEENLGTVRFKGALKASKSIITQSGSGIKARFGIEAGFSILVGSGIEAGENIKAGWNIKAGTSIKASTSIKAGTCIEAGENIKAGFGIEAGAGVKARLGIEADSGIKAGTSIETGWNIKAGFGIEAGTSIKAGTIIEAGDNIKAGLDIEAELISSGLRIFAGLCNWRNPEPAEMQIRAKLIKGTIAYGELIEPNADLTKSILCYSKLDNLDTKQLTRFTALCIAGLTPKEAFELVTTTN